MSGLQSRIEKKLLALPNNMFGTEQATSAIKSFFAMQFDSTYVMNYTEEEISEHVYGFMCARAGEAAGKVFCYRQENEKNAFFLCGGDHNDQMCTMHTLEDWLVARQKALGKSHAISIRSYHSQNVTKSVILLTADYCPFIDPSGQGTDYRSLTTDKFMKLRTKETRERYEGVYRKMLDSIQPVHTINSIGDNLLALKMCFIPDRVCYLTALITLINSIPGSSVAKKFCETLSNGMHIYTFYVRGTNKETLDRAAGLMGMLPHTPTRSTTRMYNMNLIDANEVIYCNALMYFAFYFTPPYSTEDYGELGRELTHKPMSINRLKNLRKEMFQQIMSREYIGNIIEKHVGLVKALYQDFVDGTTAESITKLKVLCTAQLRNESQLANDVVQTFLVFNQSVLKTNFFKATKAAVSFRLDPKFISVLDYPRVPFGVFFILGPQFVGFHIRFTDIARGGVRMIVSQPRNYTKNRMTLFAETYNLAYAQLLKNKDIPEGGSKGTILVSPRATYDRRRIFLQYVDSMLDLIIPDVPGVRSTMKQPEIIFLGPDENTAGPFPAYAALHAKARGYEQWKSFTTGKDQVLGGIPHDTYGMTSRGVRTYVEEIYKRLELKETTLTKFQTGGPDGDLGSNEILLSNENYIGLVDGTGSLYDPNGLNRPELMRLAKARLTIDKYDVSKLSSKGYYVNIKEKNRTLPDGTLVMDGETFRNTFHFSKFCIADTFVPCGGRPSSINLDNVHNMVIGVPGISGQNMIDGKVGNLAGSGKLRFQYIVEGANLFITHDARIALEQVGVLLVKDSSANKGGVTCSSLEVLSGLALSDVEHRDQMTKQPDGSLPEFYQHYVEEAMGVLRNNAKKEFECLWRERQKGTDNGFITLISDKLSSKIVDIRQFISESDLHNDQVLFRYVLMKYLPETLQKQISMSQILERVPCAYLRAIFAIWIASDFVYTTGVSGSNEFGFFMYMHALTKKAHANPSSKI